MLRASSEVAGPRPTNLSAPPTVITVYAHLWPSDDGGKAGVISVRSIGRVGAGASNAHSGSSTTLTTRPAAVERSTGGGKLQERGGTGHASRRP